jgi:hypothetical protein
MFVRFTSIDPSATAEVSTGTTSEEKINESANANIASRRRFVSITGVCLPLMMISPQRDIAG